MMRSEFIERTGFEPTAAEYEEIENEYMGTDIDKDAFCKMWKKQGRAERLMRIRARRIEDLEAQLAEKDRLFEARTTADAKRYHELFDKDRVQMLKMENDIETLRKNLEEANKQLADANARADEADRKLAVIREAFEILTGKEALA